MTTAVLLEGHAPGSPEWRSKMSASKVAAVLGLSPWESPYSLWMRMAGKVDPQPQNDAMSRGHYLEPAIVNWFKDQHREDQPAILVDSNGDVARGTTWAHRDRPWQIASPDAVIYNEAWDVVALLEVKTDSDGAGWGKPGTAEIPPYYAAQVQWQMDTTGVPICHVAVLSAFLEFREYVVPYNPEDAEFIRGRCEAFLQSIADDQPPAVDGHSETYQVLREYHDDVDDYSVELPPDLARNYCTSQHTAKAAEADAALYRNALAAHIGTAQKATFNGATIATRQAKNGGTPYLVKAKNLPTFNLEEAA